MGSAGTSMTCGHRDLLQIGDGLARHRVVVTAATAWAVLVGLIVFFADPTDRQAWIRRAWLIVSLWYRFRPLWERGKDYTETARV